MAQPFAVASLLSNTTEESREESSHFAQWSLTTKGPHAATAARLELVGNATHCLLVMRDLDITDQGDWTCALTDDNMETVKQVTTFNIIKHGNISLLTVDNVKIKSYKGAVDFMLEHDDYSQEDIDRVQMYPDGLRRALHGQAASVEWSTSVYLPPGWR